MAEDQESPDGTRAIKDRNQRIREEAAQKRKARREGETRRAAVQRNLDAGEMVNDALARGTHAATGFLKRNLNIIQWVVVLGAAGGIGWQIYSARKHKSDGKATDTLIAGIMAEQGRVGEEPEAEADPQTGLGDPRPHFADDAARLKAAQDAYRAASGSGSIRTLAELGLAGALFDTNKHKEALAAYQSVRESALAKTDSDVRARAIEGIGLSQEALGDKAGARKAFHELGNSEDPILSALGMYQEARLAFAANEREPAIDLLKKALKKVDKPASTDAPPSFVSQLARELLGRIDPSAVPPVPTSDELSPEKLEAMVKQAGGSKPGGAPALSKEKLNELIRAAQQKQPPQPAPSSAPAKAP